MDPEELQASSFKRPERNTIKRYNKNMKEIKKKLVRRVKRSRPAIAAEIKDMPMKDFRTLWFVVQQAQKIKKRKRLN